MPSGNPGAPRQAGPNQVAVWLCRPELLTVDALIAMERVLSSDERVRRDRFVFERDRRDFVAAHALLRIALSCYGTRSPSEWQFEANYHGKPSLVPEQRRDNGLAFNLSHSHGLVACAVSNGNSVGIDVESEDRLADGPPIDSHSFTACESGLLSAQPKENMQARLVELWTLKESYVKALGVGLRLPLNSFGFMFEDETGLSFTCPGETRQWQFWLAPSPDARG